MKQDKLKELKSLDNDNIVWIIFIILSLLNINADNHQKKYIITNNYNEKNMLIIFLNLLLLSVLLSIYLYLIKIIVLIKSHQTKNYQL